MVHPQPAYTHTSAACRACLRALCLCVCAALQKVRKGDVDTVNNDPDYDSDDVVHEAEATVLRRLRFFRREGDVLASEKGAAAGEGDGAAGSGAGSGAGDAKDADGDVAMTPADESFSDYVQTEMMCHIHLPPAALASSTCTAILDRSVLVRSQLQLAYHRLFVSCASLTPFPAYFFAYHHHRRPNRAPPQDEELSACSNRAVWLIHGAAYLACARLSCVMVVQWRTAWCWLLDWVVRLFLSTCLVSPASVA